MAGLSAGADDSTAARAGSTARVPADGPLRYTHALMLGAVLLAGTGFALSEPNAFYLALTCVAVLIHALALRRGRPIQLRRPLVNLTVLAATGFFLLEFWTQRELFQALGHYMILILLCKLLQQQRARDQAQLLILSAALVLATALVTEGMWFALLMLLYLPVACGASMALTLRRLLERQPAAGLSLEPEQGGSARADGAGRQPASGALRRKAFLAAGVCVATAVAVFLLMPRGQAGALFGATRSGRARGSVSGFSESFRLTDVGRITRDPRVVMHVRVESDAQDLGDAGYRAYLRGRYYGTYEKGEWFSWPGGMPWAGSQFALPNPPPTGGKIIIQHVTMDRSLLPATFAIAPTVRVVLPQEMIFRGGYPDMRVSFQPAEGPVRYTAYSFGRPYTPEQRQYLRAIQEIAQKLRKRLARLEYRSGSDGQVSVAIAELARRWCADLLAERNTLPAGPDAAKARDELDVRIARRIAHQLSVEYAYTLDLSCLDPDLDPVEDFLFRSRRGHCQFFASAATLMCRALGLRARLAGGFLATERNPAGGGYLVRAADAHAWCEVYTPSTDWVLIDPTPAAARDRVTGRRGALWGLWDGLRFFWRTRVVGYDEADRQNLFGWFLRRLQTAWRLIARYSRRVGEAVRQAFSQEQFSPRSLLVALPILAAAAAGLAAIVLLARSARRRGPRVPVHRSLPEFYRKLIKLLRRHGQRQRACQTVEEYLLQAAAELSLPRQQVAELAGVIYHIRWSGQPPPARALRTAEANAEDIARRLRRSRRRRKPSAPEPAR